jgi:SAM-dependent methyltransferase
MPSALSATVQPAHDGVRAFLGVTRHLGGAKATEELLRLCHLRAGQRVLDAGCGAGATVVRLAGPHRCRVVGADVSPRMLDWARRGALRAGVASRVELAVADVRELPFEDDAFDLVLCESVLAFVDDKRCALRELVRVLRPGGHIGLNEGTWLESPPRELEEYLGGAGEAVECLSFALWKALVDDVGLENVVAYAHRLSMAGQVRERMRLVGPGRVLRAGRALLTAAMRDPSLRRDLARTGRALHPPKYLREYLGYGLYVGRKPTH